MPSRSTPGTAPRYTVLEADHRVPCRAWASASFPHGIVIDDACPRGWLSGTVQRIREGLPLDRKRPTVDRRFFCDSRRGLVCKPLEAILAEAVDRALGALAADGGSRTNNKRSTVYCHKYLRFLEYGKAGSELLPHRDGTKTCEDTGARSTHTLLLFLSDCDLGGETLLMDEGDASSNWSKERNLTMSVYEDGSDSDSENANDNANDFNNANTCDESDDSKKGGSLAPSRRAFNRRRIRYGSPGDPRSTTPARTTWIFRLSDAFVRGPREGPHGAPPRSPLALLPHPQRWISAGVQPSRGRILVFPHHWPHAGAVCKSLPKIALRAEVTIGVEEKGDRPQCEENRSSAGTHALRTD